MNSKPVIIPVASGKGGVGKSFVAANLAVALADRGHSTIAVDLDLGGSNLYSFLGLSNRFAGIGDFLKARTVEFEDLLVPTGIDHLRYIPGDGRTPFMANIPYAQKIRLVSRLKRLPAEYVIFDLSSGSSYNTLDFFRITANGLLVTVPEYPAVMNMMTFIKHMIIRAIERKFATNPAIRGLLQEQYKQPIDGQLTSIEGLQQKISAIDPEGGKVMAALCRIYRPRLVFNKVDHPEELRVSARIDAGLRSVLSMAVDYFGYIFTDHNIRRSVNDRALYVRQFPDRPAAQSLGRIADRIVKYWTVSVKDSAARIMADAARVYQE